MNWLFGRKAAPDAVRPFVPAWLRGGAEEEGFARSYDVQFDEVYRKNPVGQRAVRLVAGMLGALPVFAVEGDEQAAKLIQADGLLEAITADLLLHGNAFVQLIAGDDDLPAELCLLRPERVSVVCDERGWPTAYLYRAAGRAVRIGRTDALERRQIAHIRALHRHRALQAVAIAARPARERMGDGRPCGGRGVRVAAGRDVAKDCSRSIAPRIGRRSAVDPSSGCCTAGHLGNRWR